MSNHAAGEIERYRDLAAVAELMPCGLQSAPGQRVAFESTTLYLAGYGSIARPMSERLLDLGFRQFVLVDPKRYRKASVASQCEPADVGRLKVEVGAGLLRRGGADVSAFPSDLSACPDGLVLENTIVVASVDTRRGDILANRLAARMQARLVKVNIEPRYHFISARCYDFRRPPAVCCECQLSERAYQTQTHPKSCDNPAGRRTAAPRWLSQAAANVAALVIAQLADERTATGWYGRQWELMLDNGRWEESELTASPACRWEHGRHWPNLKRLRRGPGEVRLERLFELAEAEVDDATHLRFCQQVATRLLCDRCRTLVESIHWLSDVDQAVARCRCGGNLLPVPYWTYRQLPAGQMLPVLDQPLAVWGVDPYAVIEIISRQSRRSYVVGPGQPEGDAR